MTTQPAEHLTPLEGMIGRWRSSGSVLDEDGFTVVATISGTDVYSWASSGNWIVHDVDVLMGDERTLVTELIGGGDPESDGWQMHAFDNSESPGQMSSSRKAMARSYYKARECAVGSTSRPAQG